MKPSDYVQHRFKQAAMKDEYPISRSIQDTGLEAKILVLLEAVEADDKDPSSVEVQLRTHMNTNALELILRAALGLKEK